MKKSDASWKIACLCLILSACSTPEMLVDKKLQEESMAYEVNGRNGWLINQRLSFGEYESGKVNRSWTKGYDFPFIVRFTGAKEKLSFSLKNAEGVEAEIFCLGKLREQDLTLFHEYFDINLKAKDAFTGSVVVSENAAFDFYVTNLNQNNWFREAKGWIRGENAKFEIRPVKMLGNNQRSLGMQAPGFEFVRNNKVVGAVETLNQGRVWLHNDLNEDQKLVLAGVASALLLRSELADHNDPST